MDDRKTENNGVDNISSNIKMGIPRNVKESNTNIKPIRTVQEQRRNGQSRTTVDDSENLRHTCRKLREKLSNELKILEGKAFRPSKTDKKESTLNMSSIKQAIPQAIQNKIHNDSINCNGYHNGTYNNSSTSKKNTNNQSALRQRTRRELESIIQGLQQLLLLVSLNNRSLQNQTKNFAKTIPQLKNFPLFEALPQLQKNLFSSIENNISNNKCNEGTEDDSETSSSVDEGQVQKDVVKHTVTERKKTKCNKISNKHKESTEATHFVQYINGIIKEYLGKNQKDKIELLKFTHEDLNNLEAYAQNLVEAGLGRIVEQEIRVNRKNNRQAFVVLSIDRETHERDGIITLPVARQYAFDGDIVRAFVLNPGKDAEHHSSTDKLEQENNENGSKNNNDAINGEKINRQLPNNTTDSQNSIEEIFYSMESSSDNELENDLDSLHDSLLPAVDNCPKAFVIKVITQAPMRQVVGTINFKNISVFSCNKRYYKLKPHDMRVPLVYVPVELCNQDMINKKENNICGHLYLAKIIETDVHGRCIGELLQCVGKAGILEDEVKAILFQNGFANLKAYDQKFQDMYDKPMPPIDKEQLRIRDDLRQKCIFTIDPLTARDLDDALSIDKLYDDVYEVGVHISDVSYFFNENSELDNLVKERATSVYLINEVIHMLPQSLCYKCSLLPGEDKFTFSVFWHLNDKAEIINGPRFVRSIIKSCTQFAYEHAQKIIDYPDDDFGSNDFPEILNNWTPKDIKWRILALNKLAQKLRAKRYENGAISINNPRLRFTLDPLSGEPLSYELEDRKEANLLIEEFMLLANQSVAKYIYEYFPETSILRHHGPPLTKSMKALRDRLLGMGIDFDISSSKNVYTSMKRLCANAVHPEAVDACLNALLTKPMARARYFCSEGKTAADLWHYALSVPIYTHFTSPIRRYPDILVHRLLAAAINCGPVPQRSSDELHALAKICNDQKFNARKVGDDLINLYFIRYIKSQQPVVFKAVVTDIFQHLMNVVVIETGHTIAINYKMQKVLVDIKQVPQYLLIMEKNSTMPPTKLQLFSTLEIKLVIFDGKLCGFIVSPDPVQSYLNSVEDEQQHRVRQRRRRRHRYQKNERLEQF